MTSKERNKILERVACEGFDKAIRRSDDIEDEEFNDYRSSYIGNIELIERYIGL